MPELLLSNTYDNDCFSFFDNQHDNVHGRAQQARIGCIINSNHNSADLPNLIRQFKIT